MASLKPSLRKNYMNVKATDGKGLDEKAKQIRADIPKYKASQKKVRIEDILKDSDLGSENIENELLDEILGKGRRKASAPKDTNNSGSVGSNIKVSIYDGKTTRDVTPGNSKTSSSSLVTSMASRLSALEKSHKKMRLELVQKDKELLKMKRKCQLLMKENESLQHSTTAEETGDDTGVVTGDETKSSYEGKIASETSSDKRNLPSLSMADNIIELESKNRRLRNQVHEMESFLKDYGLVWVGRNDGENDHAHAPKPNIDFAILFARLDELNEIAGAGKKVVQVKGKKAVFGRVEGIPLTIYKDGKLKGKKSIELLYL
eukprot:g12385.t1